MFSKFLRLEWKSFTRSASFTGNMILKIFMIIGKINLAILFAMGGVGMYFIFDDEKMNPVENVNKFIIYYFLADLTIRIIFQSIPVMNIRPLLPMPIKRGTVISFIMGKTFVSIFTLLPAFFFIPFAILLLFNGGYPALNVIVWMVSLWALVYINNLINLLLNDIDNLFIVFIAAIAGLGALQYYNLFNITLYTAPLFNSFYNTPYMFLLPVIVLTGVWKYTFAFYTKAMYLDTGLKGKHTEAVTQNFTWLNRFGLMGTFLKNDIKLIKRNKRPRNMVLQGLFLFAYAIFLLSGVLEQYNTPYWKVFGALALTNGFMFTFGQLVPSWDSAYYPLMMSQNIKYREYIAAKWWLIVVATALTTLLASFCLFFGVEVYLMVLAAALYNIGVNSHLALLSGAFIKTPIDLTTTQQAFGGKKAFNIKAVLLVLPKLILPFLVFMYGDKLLGHGAGTALVAALGILGFAFKNMVFKAIEKVYVSEKYSTIDAYKQKN